MNFKSNLVIELLIAPYLGLTPLIGFAIFSLWLFGRVDISYSMLELKHLSILIGLIHLWGFARYFYFCTNIKILKNKILIEKDYLFYKKEISLNVESIKYVSVKYNMFESNYKWNEITTILHSFIIDFLFESIFVGGYNRVIFYEKERLFSFNFSNLLDGDYGDGYFEFGYFQLMLGELQKNGIRCEEE